MSSLLIAAESTGIGQLMDCQHYSKLHKLLRVTALVKKFAAQFKLLISCDRTSVDWTASEC